MKYYIIVGKLCCDFYVALNFINMFDAYKLCTSIRRRLWDEIITPCRHIFPTCHINFFRKFPRASMKIIRRKYLKTLVPQNLRMFSWNSLNIFREFFVKPSICYTLQWTNLEGLICFFFHVSHFFDCIYLRLMFEIESCDFPLHFWRTFHSSMLDR